MDTTPKMLVSEYFKNQEIFITGGSGFIGKVLIEKLLRSCPDVGKIFVLLRARKGKSAEERLQDVLNNSLYDRLRREQPQTISKVYAIEGDCAELRLGINAEDLEKIKNVSIVYHAAATVRFDENLRDSLLLNTRGTFEMVKIAETLKSLKVFMHVSTMYCNTDKDVVEEKMYPAFADWRAAIKLAETQNTETLNILFPKYSNNKPNTYTFTKSLSEQIINDYRNRLPMIIFRPSIVISSYEEPEPGWADNFNNLTGLLAACGTGHIRILFANPDNKCDVVSVDMVVRAMLVACYKMETDKLSLKTYSNKGIEVINCAVAGNNFITMGTSLKEGCTFMRQNPFDQMVWVPRVRITMCPAWFYINVMAFQVLWSILFDFALRVTKQTPFLIKTQRRIYNYQLKVRYFWTTSFNFRNDNFRSLDNVVPHSEIQTFGHMHYTQSFDHTKFMRNCVRGIKVNLFKEHNNSRAARRRVQVFQVVDFCMKLIAGMLAISLAVRYFDIRLQSTWEALLHHVKTQRLNYLIQK